MDPWFCHSLNQAPDFATEKYYEKQMCAKHRCKMATQSSKTAQKTNNLPGSCLGTCAHSLVLYDDNRNHGKAVETVYRPVDGCWAVGLFGDNPTCCNGGNGNHSQVAHPFLNRWDSYPSSVFPYSIAFLMD